MKNPEELIKVLQLAKDICDKESDTYQYKMHSLRIGEYIKNTSEEYAAFVLKNDCKHIGLIKNDENTFPRYECLDCHKKFESINAFPG